MKSIEERAKEYADRLKNAEISDFGIATVYSYKDVYNANMAAYKRGANEQKAIDEAVRLKKCDDITQAEYNRETAFVDWYLENGKGMPAYSDAIEWARKDLLDKAWSLAYSMYQAGRDNLIPLTKDEFIKAMEE